MNETVSHNRPKDEKRVRRVSRLAEREEAEMTRMIETWPSSDGRNDVRVLVQYPWMQYKTSIVFMLRRKVQGNIGLLQQLG
jgi:hypothetical protein